MKGWVTTTFKSKRMSTSIYAKKIDFSRNCLVINGTGSSCCVIPLTNIVAYLQREENYGNVNIEFIMLGGYQIKVLTERNLDEGSWSTMNKFLNIWMNNFDPKPDTEKAQ